jgi:cytochrome P450 family 110
VLATVLDTFEFESNLMSEVKADRRGITFVPPEVFRLTIV